MMDVPVVAASWFEGDVHWTTVLGIERSQITITDEILGVGGVQFAFRPYVKIDILFHILLCVNVRHCQEQCDNSGDNSHCLV